MALPVTCMVCAPPRMGSAVPPPRFGSPAWPQVAMGGAPVLLSVPPWQAKQVAKSFAVPPALWQLAQATLTVPPSSAAPWQLWHCETSAFALKAWKPGLAVFIQSAPWPVASTWPSRCFPPAEGGMTLPAVSMVAPWQALHAGVPPVTVGCGDGGGMPWHVPHAAWPVPTLVQTGAVLLPPLSVTPWQYVAQVAVERVQDAVVPCPASPEKVTVASGVPLEPTSSTWPESSAVAGFTWHSAQSNAGARLPPVTC